MNNKNKRRTKKSSIILPEDPRNEVVLELMNPQSKIERVQKKAQRIK